MFTNLLLLSIANYVMDDLVTVPHVNFVGRFVIACSLGVSCQIESESCLVNNGAEWYS